MGLEKTTQVRQKTKVLQLKLKALILNTVHYIDALISLKKILKHEMKGTGNNNSGKEITQMCRKVNGSVNTVQHIAVKF